MTTNSIKHICDRCGNSVTKDTGKNWYPKNWQHLTLYQTGATLDLCSECNVELYKFLSEKDATDMDKACFNDRDIL